MKTWEVNKKKHLILKECELGRTPFCLYKKNRTAVESVQLGKALELSKILRMSFCWKSSHMLNLGVQHLLDHRIFVRNAHIPNLRPLGPFLHVEKFVVVVGLRSGFKSKLNKN